MRLDPQLVKHQIECLRITHPELCEDEDAWLLSLESETDFQEAIERIEQQRQEAAHMAGGCATHIAELEQRQARWERKEQAMRKLAFGLMKAADVQKVTLPAATLSVSKGRMKLVIPDETAVPDEFCRIKKEPDKTRIKAAMETGAFAPNWAAMEPSPETLSIRTK